MVDVGNNPSNAQETKSQPATVILSAFNNTHCLELAEQSRCDARLYLSEGSSLRLDGFFAKIPLQRCVEFRTAFVRQYHIWKPTFLDWLLVNQ